MSRKLVVIVLCVLFVSSCSHFKEQPLTPETTAPRFVMHEVKYPGETYGLIALWYTGKVSHWKTLQKANPEIDVKNIQLQSRVRIPEKLAQQRNPYTSDEFLALSTRLHGTAPKRPQVHITLISASDQKPEQPRARFYPVKSIAGCEGFDNSSTGLASCAQFIDQQIQLP